MLISKKIFGLFPFSFAFSFHCSASAMGRLEYQEINSKKKMVNDFQKNKNEHKF